MIGPSALSDSSNPIAACVKTGIHKHGFKQFTEYQPNHFKKTPISIKVT